MNLKNILIPIGILFGASTQAQQGFKINTKVGEINEYCYHIPCSVTKSISTKTLSATKNKVVLKAIVLGGEKNERTSKIIWNSKPHSITITCSKNNPKVNGEIIDLTTGTIPGAEMTRAEIYFNYCHSSKIHPEIAVEKYEYVVENY